MLSTQKAATLIRCSKDYISKIELGKRVVADNKFTLEDFRKAYSLSELQYKKLCVLYEKKHFTLDNTEDNFLVIQSILQDIFSSSKDEIIKSEEEITSFILKAKSIFKNKLSILTSYDLDVSLLKQAFKESKEKLSQRNLETYLDYHNDAEIDYQEVHSLDKERGKLIIDFQSLILGFLSKTKLAINNLLDFENEYRDLCQIFYKTYC